MKLSDLAGLSHNYDAVGATRSAVIPSGYHRLYHRARLGEGTTTFRRAGDALMSWRMQSDLRIQATGPRAEVGVYSLGRLGVGPLGVPVPCRVVWTVDEPARIGFAYGTLTGHPAAGEESFMVTLEDGVVWFTVLAYSRADRWYTRLGGPLTRLGQSLTARRYATVLRRLMN
jgi:uncharacterized protein (UPF0548 family)